mgnify:CR=1 FL=1
MCVCGAPNAVLGVLGGHICVCVARGSVSGELWVRIGFGEGRRRRCGGSVLCVDCVAAHAPLAVQGVS